MNLDHVADEPIDAPRFLGQDAFPVEPVVNDMRRHDDHQLALRLRLRPVAEQGADVRPVADPGDLVLGLVVRLGDKAAQRDGLAILGDDGRLDGLAVELRGEGAVAQVQLRRRNR